MQSSYLYVIGPDRSGPLKLGFSADPERRLKQLQTGHALPLYLYHSEPVAGSQARRLESLLHKSFNHRRQRGEWFDMIVADAISCIQIILIEHEPSELDVNPFGDIALNIG
jgi:Meiotically up-regulated gene 113